MFRSGYSCALIVCLALAVAALTAPPLHAAVITDFAVFGNTGVTIAGGGDVFGGMVGSNSGTVSLSASGSVIPEGLMGGGNYQDSGSANVGSLTFNGSVTTGSSTVVNGNINAGTSVSIGASYTVNGSVYAGTTLSFGGGAATGITGSVHVGSSALINAGSTTKIGGDFISNGSITTGSTSTLGGSIHSGGTVTLGTSNKIGLPVDANKITINATGNIAVAGGASNVEVDGNLNAGGNINMTGTGNTVYGDATAAGTNTGGTVAGTRTAGGTPDAPLTPTAPTAFTAVTMPTASAGTFTGGPAVTSMAGITHATPLAPGQYNNLNLGSTQTLFLTAGDYYFNGTFVTGSLSNIRLNTSGGEINIFISGNVTIAGSTKLSLDHDGNGSYDAVSTVLGDPVRKAAVANVYWETNGTFNANNSSIEWIGTVFAPSSTVTFGGSGSIIGGLYSNSTVTLNSSGTQVNYVEAAMLHINNSVLSLPPGTLDFGNVLVGYTDSQNVLLSKTGADATTYTALANNGGLGVGASGAFAGGNQNENLSVSLLANANGTGTAGAKNWTVTIDNTGRNSQDPNKVLSVTAAVYQAASLTANDSTTLGDGGAVSIANAVAAPLRATAYVDSYNISADWTLVGLGVGSAIAPGSNTSGAHVSLDQTGLLNGQTVTGLLSIALENDQSLGGAAHQDLGTYHWNLSHTVTGNVGTGTADVGNGGSYAGLNGVSDQTLGSTAALLAGTNTSGGDTVVEVAWRDRTAGEAGGFAATLPTGALGLFSDVAEITGTDGTIFVLELSVDPSVLLTAYTDVFLSWYDTGDDLWKLATLGNHGTNTTNPLLLNYQGSWAASGAGLTLGAYGFDAVNLTVWAVLDHNSEFSTLGIGSYEVIPEPSALAVLTAWALGLLGRRRRRR